jgi:hypothetical protein
MAIHRNKRCGGTLEALIQQQINIKEQHMPMGCQNKAQ